MRATTLSQLFIEEMRCDYEQSSISNTTLAFRHFEQAVGSKDIDRVNQQDGQRFKNWCMQEDYSPTSANMWFRAIRRVFNWAVDDKKLLDANPLGRVRQLKVTRKPVMVYDDDEVWAMIEKARDLRIRSLILAAWTTGFRIGELLNVTRDNVRGGRIHVEAKRRTAETWRWVPKTQDIREVPLVDLLAAWIDRLDCFYVFLRPERYAHLLDLDQRGLMTAYQRRRPEDNYHRMLMRIHKRAFGRRIGDWHQFRRTYITNLSHLPEQALMQLSGHRDRRTLTHYTAVRWSMFEDARKSLTERVKSGHPDSADTRRRWAM